MYRVIKYFTDLQDNNHAYHVGEQFPHDGMEVSEARLIELSTNKNRQNVPLIAKVEVEAAQVDEVVLQEPVEGFMNPPEQPTPDAVDTEKPKKKRGRPRNDAE